MSKKTIAIIAGSAVALIAVAVTLFFVIPKDKSYRLLKLFEFSGSGTGLMPTWSSKTATRSNLIQVS